MIANLLYVVVGIILTVLALLSVRDPETHEIVERMNVPGLVAHQFESKARHGVKTIEETFQELSDGVTSRVTIAPTQEGGYSYWAI
jgi:hypothetical protein